MIARVFALWVVGLLTIVPYAAYRLFFLAERGEYAFLITIGLFWIFGYWSLVGPLVAACQVRRIARLIRAAKSADELRTLLADAGMQDQLLEWAARESNVPKFVLRFLWRRVGGLLTNAPSSTAPGRPPGGGKTPGP
jgi:hypothetical protein